MGWEEEASALKFLSESAPAAAAGFSYGDVWVLEKEPAAGVSVIGRETKIDLVPWLTASV